MKVEPYPYPLAGDLFIVDALNWVPILSNSLQGSFFLFKNPMCSGALGHQGLLCGQTVEIIRETSNINK